MSTSYRKIKYKEEGGEFGEIEKELYCIENNVCDVIEFYDSDFKYLFTVDFTQQKNMISQLLLLAAYDDECKEMTAEEIKKCKR